MVNGKKKLKVGIRRSKGRGRDKKIKKKFFSACYFFFCFMMQICAWTPIFWWFALEGSLFVNGSPNGGVPVCFQKEWSCLAQMISGPLFFESVSKKDWNFFGNQILSISYRCQWSSVCVMFGTTTRVTDSFVLFFNPIRTSKETRMCETNVSTRHLFVCMIVAISENGSFFLLGKQLIRCRWWLRWT